ncbi:MAG TPA: response regulator [Longimicrobiales bacterium]|nr:response regulator [Longimicrobiales bacterium]
MQPLILIVDPNVDQRRILASLLEDRGYAAEGAATAEAALASIARRRPALIIGEHPVPLPDGRALCTALAEDSATRDLPFLALTSRAMAAELQAARAAHPAGVLVKPVPLSRIVARVSELIGPIESAPPG